MAGAANAAYSGGMADDAGRADALAHVSNELKARDRERWLSCFWAPAAARPALMALHALDAEMARIVTDIREPLLAEIRLAWWREQVQALASGARPPAQPLLQLLALEARPRVDLERLIGIEEAFLPLVSAGPFSALRHCQLRGRALFEAAYAACGREDAAGRAAARAAGEVWAAADLRWQTWAPDLTEARANDGVPAASDLTVRQVRALPAPLRALAALAAADLSRTAKGQAPAPRATAGRQLLMVRAALLPRLRQR